MSFIPEGKWIISYSENSSLRDIFEILPLIEKRLSEQKLKDFEKIYVDLQKEGTSSFREKGGNLYLTINPEDRSGHFSSLNLTVPDENYSLPPIPDLVTLIYPYLKTDKRWETIDVTTASIFIGSSLVRKGFKVDTLKATFDELKECSLKQNSVLGLTLFEDLLPETADLLKNLKENSSILIAAGGPSVTLNPMETAYYLDMVNFFIRGEADTSFAELMAAVQNNSIDKILEIPGVVVNLKGLLIISDFNQSPKTEDFSNFAFDLSFLKKHHLKEGLEINISRGCERSCLFCSKVQGRKVRKLPLPLFSRLLDQVSAFGTPGYININDDDILQDQNFAGEVFDIIRSKGFRTWGIQTSVNSFFTKEMNIDTRLIDLVSDNSLYVDGSPLLWLGTDVFTQERGRRAGKKIPDVEKIKELVETFEVSGIRNYHYWISSDHESSWPEFVEEFCIITELMRNWSGFKLLPHAPFTVPYVSTPIYRLISGNDKYRKQLRFKSILNSSTSYPLPLAEKLVTPSESLNSLLNNENRSGEGFFTYLKNRDFFNCFLTIYNYVKDDRMRLSSFYPEEAEILRKTESELENILSTL